MIKGATSGGQNLSPSDDVIESKNDGKFCYFVHIIERATSTALQHTPSCIKSYQVVLL